MKTEKMDASRNVAKPPNFDGGKAFSSVGCGFILAVPRGPSLGDSANPTIYDFNSDFFLKKHRLPPMSKSVIVGVI